MKKCIFCGVSLTAENRSQEHILRYAFLERLGHLRTPVSLAFSAKGNAIPFQVRNYPAETVKAGDICRPCNNGWMNYLDLAVEDILFRLATGCMPSDDINENM
ncbi:MAG TPA: hypothetical protein VMF06_03095, partial [Candidatus Limnocylindria bacterium]|nr:hypothetical protein [Candidatus Limnocylindria bacterium]